MDKVILYTVQTVKNGYVLTVNGEDYDETVNVVNEQYVAYELGGLHTLLDTYVYPNM